MSLRKFSEVPYGFAFSVTKCRLIEGLNVEEKENQLLVQNTIEVASIIIVPLLDIHVCT